MKLSVLMLFVPVTIAFPGISSAQTWLASFQQPLRNLIDNPFQKSTIPQFILDARHAWVLANRRKLERLSNAEAFLCADPLQELAESEKVEINLEVPHDLFHNLEIDNNRVGISRPGWPNALERLREMKGCPRALNEVRALEVQIYVHDGEYSDLSLRVLEPSRPPGQLLTLFGDVLSSMTQLETLKWNIRKGDTHLFEQAFTSRNLTLPTVKHFVPGPFSQYLVGMCPNLELLENGGGSEWWHGYMPGGHDWHLLLIQAAAATPKLKRFSMDGGHSGWTPSLFVKSMPQVESLGVIGSLGRKLEWTKIDRRLKEVLVVLGGLSNLTHLDLPDSSTLGLGFDGGPGCGNAYFGKEVRKYLRQVIQEGAEATEEGGNIVIATLPQLTSFKIGGSKPNITHKEGKMSNVTWPWTGMMDEWVLEEVPE